MIMARFTRSFAREVESPSAMGSVLSNTPQPKPDRGSRPVLDHGTSLNRLPSYGRPGRLDKTATPSANQTSNSFPSTTFDNSSFKPGLYLYVGSGQRNLCARLERHSRKDKPLRWHIDHLSIHAHMIGAMIVSGSRDRECELARELRHIYELAVPGFGASDCRCGGHLFYAARL